MTKLLKAVKRSDTRSGLVVTLYPGGILGIREIGRRKELSEPLDYVWSWMAKREADRIVAARKAARGKR